MGKSKCLTCGTTSTSRWYKNKTQCASCNKKEQYAKNKDKYLAKSREWNADNKEVKKKLNGNWYSENREHRLDKNIVFKENNPEYAKEWRKVNPDVTNALSAKYRAKKLNATIGNYDEEIKNIYSKAKELQLLDGVSRYVHHIVPLQEYENIISGLHVPWNLEVLTKEEHLEAHEELRKSYDRSRTNS